MGYRYDLITRYRQITILFTKKLNIHMFLISLSLFFFIFINYMNIFWIKLDNQHLTFIILFHFKDFQRLSYFKTHECSFNISV